MNREFKFRVWHNPLQRMFYSDSHEDAEFWGAKLGDSVLVTFVYTFMNLFVDKSGQLMQYTGLKDKNGKEIYEGDIILYPWAGGTFSKGIIEYQIPECSSPRFIAKTIGNDENGDEINFDRRCEVIGNIYDNPKLMKEN